MSARKLKQEEYKMKKEITTRNKNRELTLAKSKNLMNITNKILAKKTSKELVDWMQRLYLQENQLTKLPKEWISDLKEKGCDIHIDDDISHGKVWIDTDTDLMWQVKLDYNHYTWDEAHISARKLNKKKYGGFGDWRVANKNELESLMTKNKYKNRYYIKSPLFESVDSSSGYFWSSRELSANKAWRASFGHGYSFKADKTCMYAVRCVRNNI